MREFICFCLLLLFAAVFPLCVADIEDYKEYKTLLVLFIGIGMAASFMQNKLVEAVGLSFPTELPKKFRDKLTPIYKITTSEKIEKWELQNVAFQQDAIFYFLPLVALFGEWKYVKVRTVRNNTPADQIENLADVFEFLATEEDFKKLRELEAEEKKNEPFNRLNKPFKDNYI